MLIGSRTVLGEKVVRLFNDYSWAGYTALTIHTQLCSVLRIIGTAHKPDIDVGSQVNEELLHLRRDILPS